MHHQPPSSVATIGFFDGVHLGHQFLLQQVRQEAARRGMEAMAVTFAQHPGSVLRPDFRPRLLTTLQEKRGFIAQSGIKRCEVLDFTTRLSRLTAAAFMEHCLLPLGVRVLVVGYDHRFGCDRQGYDGLCAAGSKWGIEVVKAQALIDKKTPISSSFIRQLLDAGRADSAAQALGRPYAIGGTIVQGRQVGHTLGFPTANLQPACADKIIPRHGAYAVRAAIGGHTYGGMTNIGSRPTLENGQDASIETHIFGFHAEAYGQPLTLHFIRRLRDEQRFDSLEALRQQLRLDAATAQSLLTDT